ncbi:protein-transporting protein [Martiniozyma asiatica (nom. inval.)]|nr:protein-transporting protein [Martiniozyma asiatica]
MSKRTRLEEDSDIDISSSEDEKLEVQSDDEMEDMVNVDFDFYNLNPDIDFHATKNFLRQLFQDDSVFFPLSELADMILKEGHLGTTIKTEGMESDPFSMLTVLNFSDNLNNKAIKSLADYFLEKSASNSPLNNQLKSLLTSTSKQRIGMIFSQRLINMPVETSPPMYNMLLEEMENAADKEKEYNFDYYLIPSRVYQILSSKADKELEDEETSGSRKKAKSGSSGPATFDYMHYEDEIFEKNAVSKGYFEYTHKKVDSDGRRVFNDYAVDPKLSLILLNKESMLKSVKEMAEEFPY